MGHGIITRRDIRAWRRRQRGQSLIIFALSLTVLLGLAGLAVDVTRLYDQYARMQRAAEAGALAGVLYMPNHYNSPLPAPGDGNTAISRASQEVVKNGFGTAIGSNVTSDCPNPVTSVAIAVCQVPNQPNQLKVIVTQTITVVLLGGLGVGPTTLSTSGQAAYLSPLALGVNSSAASYFGDLGECNSTGGTVVNCNPTSGTTHVQNFMANINGPGELKEMGDPYVYCEEGPSQGPPSGSADPSLTSSPLPYTAYNGLATNHPQYSDGSTSTLAGITASRCGVPNPSTGYAGNPDQQVPGYEGSQTGGTSHPGAYNYGITIPTANAGASIWIYNPKFIPWIASSNNCHGKMALDTFYKGPNCSAWYPNYGTLAFNGHFDDPSFYFNTTYSLYSVDSLYFRNLDTQIQTQLPNCQTGTGTSLASVCRPFDQMTADLQLHGCQTNGSQVYDFQATNANSSYSGASINAGIGCTSSPPCQMQWCPLATSLQPGTYRLAVEATSYKQQSGTTLLSGWGQHGYGVKVCSQTLTTTNPGDAVGCAPGGTVSAWNDMDIIFSFPSSSSTNTVPMAEVPYTYAGRSITISLYDVCDSSVTNTCWAEIVPPTTASDTGTPNPTINVTYPSGLRLSANTCDNKNSIQGANNGDNIYNGLWLNTTVQLPPNYQGGVWSFVICSKNGTEQDVTNVKFTLLGSAVYLVPPS